MLEKAITAIRGEFGHDPPSSWHVFSGEGFYFMTSMED